MPSNKKLLQAAAGSAGGTEGYVEDVFSTFLYDGTASAITVNNGIDLSGEGGLTWLKSRSLAEGHILVDTINGAGTGLISSGTNALFTLTDGLTAFNSNGFTLGTSNIINTNASTNVSWSFRKAPKFFDVVTYTGNATSGRTIAHSLGSTPGMMIVKQTSGVYNWQIYHSGFGATKFLEFNTGATQTSTAIWNDTAPTDSVFTVGNEYGVNRSGYTYVAYLFASDAGGYGDDGDENIIKCGGYTADSSNAYPVTLGFEPQFVLIKKTSGTGKWEMLDTMRGFTADAAGQEFLYSNLNDAEASDSGAYLTATGFVASNQSASNGASYIYMAIRRPMKTPEAGTEVFNAITRTGTGANATITGLGFNPDEIISQTRGLTYGGIWFSRLRGGNQALYPPSTAAEYTSTNCVTEFSTNGYKLGTDGSNQINSNTVTYVNWCFKRATGFMDVVAYTGNGTAGATQAHNLGVVPEMMIVKRRSATDLWPVYHATLGNTKYIQLNSDVPEGAWSGTWNNTTPTASVFSLGNGSYTNTSSSTYVAYLFATLAGISKVGSYTGTGSSLNVDCGFTGGARFILIRRYNYPSGGSEWYIYDSVRGIIAGNDPYLLMNSTAAEVTSTDYIDPLNAGFTVTSNASSTVNVNGGTYIFLAIA